jgi:DNA-nicking Smr family endonuclease
MKPKRSSLTTKSFQDLSVLLECKSLSLPDHRRSDVTDHESQLDPHVEEELFEKAMEGVTPITRDNYVERIFQTALPVREGPTNRDDVEILRKLTNLVKYGEGFNISDTPEYIEGTGYHVHPSVARRLHQGDYSIQTYIDLHGFRADEAKEILDRFLKWAVTTDKRGVLVIHGRGLSSPLEPVLKKKVVEWLTHGPWRKWVVAYSSARHCDGGAGATYVLLRKRAISKRFKMKRVDADRKSS